MSENSTTALDLTSFSSDELRQLVERAQAMLAEREAASAGRRMVKVDGIRVCLDKTGKSAMAITPYHPDSVTEFRTLNGKWQPGNAAWVFDARDIDRVRAVVSDVFGTDGSAPVEVCDVEMVLLGKDTSDKNRFALGREIVSRAARDSRVKLGDGVTIVSGSFTGRCGSRNNPTVMRYGEEPVTVLVRDVPAILADVAAATEPEIYRIV